MLSTFITVFILCYIWHGLGVTVGYHRLLSHRSFACPKAVEYFWVMAGYLAFEGSPIWWATIHRAHHRYSDTILDPHSPRLGLSYAHTGWTRHKTYPSYIDPNVQSRDLIKDPIYAFLEHDGKWQRAHLTCFVVGITFRILLFLVFGWAIALASLLAGFAVLQIPLMLNIVCHMPGWGYKSYATNDDSINVWWVALFALGEGWHNNHHASQGSAKTGIKAHEFDFSWLVIRAMHALRIVKRINIVNPAELNRRLGIKNAARSQAAPWR